MLALAYSPDGRSLAAATLNGHISIVDVQSEEITATIEGRHDLGYTRREGDKITAKKSADGKSVGFVDDDDDNGNVVDFSRGSTETKNSVSTNLRLPVKYKLAYEVWLAAWLSGQDVGL